MFFFCKCTLAIETLYTTAFFYIYINALSMIKQAGVRQDLVNGGAHPRLHTTDFLMGYRVDPPQVGDATDVVSVTGVTAVAPTTDG